MSMMRLFRLRRSTRMKRSEIALISFRLLDRRPSPMSKRCIETGQIWRSPRDSLHRLTRPFLFLRTNKLTRICFQTLSNLSSTAFAWSSFHPKWSDFIMARIMLLPICEKKCHFFLISARVVLMLCAYFFSLFGSFWHKMWKSLRKN